METHKLLGAGGLFILFVALFSIYPLMNQETLVAEEPVMAQRAMMMESAPTAADANITNENERSIWPVVLMIIVLSSISTFLSWQVVDKVLQDKNEVVLLSFDDDQGKKMVDVLTNDTSRKIIDVLSSDELTASQISDKLGMSLQRVHYNLKNMEKAGIIQADSYKYSERGKEMDVYSLTKKYFVIGPRE